MTAMAACDRKPPKLAGRLRRQPPKAATAPQLCDSLYERTMRPSMNNELNSNMLATKKPTSARPL